MQLAVAVLMLCVHLPKICALSDASANIAYPIYNGAEAQEGAWPWHATIYKVTENTTSYLCGGSVVDNRTILTAAHCLIPNPGSSVMGPDQLSVHVGRNHLSVSNRNLQVLRVAKIIIHPDYTFQNVANDIAIIQLSSGITITHSVKPVTFANTNDDISQLIGRNGTMIGFGLDENDRISGTLREATLTVVDFLDCLTNNRLGYGSVLISNMFCAVGKSNASACNGYSGGGMFFNIDGIWHLRGIVSFIQGRKDDPFLCDSTKPMMFTDVSKYREWILRYTYTEQLLKKLPDIEKWKELSPCPDGAISESVGWCNAASRHEYGFLFLGSYNGILRFSLGDGNLLRLASITGVVIEMTADCAEGQIFWIHWGIIYSAHYDGNNKKPFIVEEVPSPTKLAVDWISRRLYWCDFEKKTIEVASLDNSKVRTVLFIDLVTYCIAVDPIQGKLYWTNRVEDNIEWSNLDGSEREIFIKLPSVFAIVDMKVDKATGDLCYSNLAEKKIGCINTRSKRIRTIAQLNGGTDWTTLATSTELLYWKESLSGQIERMDHEGIRQSPMNINGSVVLYIKEAITNICPMIHSQCAINNGGCRKGTICLLSPRDSGKICKQIKTHNFD